MHARFQKVNEEGRPNLIYPLITSNGSGLMESREQEQREKLKGRRSRSGFRTDNYCGMSFICYNEAVRRGGFCGTKGYYGDDIA